MIRLFSTVLKSLNLLDSDHNAVMCRVSFDAPCCMNSGVSTQTLDLSRADWALYNALLGSVNWDDMFVSSDPDVMWHFLKDNLLEAAAKAIPSKRPTRFFCGMSVSGDVKRALNARRKTFKRYRNCSADFCADKLRDADERLQLALHNARVYREKNIALSLSTSPRLFWKHIHNNLGSKPSVYAVETADGSLTISDDETANEMNRYFSTVFIAEDNDNHPHLPFKTPFKLNIVQVSSQFVLETLLTLPLRTSAGPDDIPNEFFSKAAYTICDVLTRFFRFLFEHGILPSEWRLANVTPIFKKGNHNLCSNYRPISLTCTCCKIAERVVKDCI